MDLFVIFIQYNLTLTKKYAPGKFVFMEMEMEFGCLVHSCQFGDGTISTKKKLNTIQNDG